MMVVHVVVIDLKKSDIKTFVTPGKPRVEYPLNARTTSQFLEEFNVQLAINGDGFTPWHSNGLHDYYPHPGDPVAPIGFAASKGKIYSPNTESEPVLYLSPTNQAHFNTAVGKIFNAISGNIMLVEKGKMSPDLKTDLPDEHNQPQPRTAVGLDKNGKKLTIVIVDGRQPGYSQGATLLELAGILLEFNVHNGMNLDGGGSSTLVVMDPEGKSKVLNSPVNNHIPGRERAIANHLGFFAKPNQ
jgi:exopolysaccharide biosynthesis protein